MRDKIILIFMTPTHKNFIKNYPAVDIIVCSRNNKDITSQCIDSLLALSYPNYKIILIDDYSTDDSISFLEKKYLNINIIKNKKNLGTTKTRNIGINSSEGKYIVTMDNDAILTPNWLDKMVELMESDESIGQAVGKILFFDDHQKIAAAGGSMYYRGKGYDIGFGELDNGQYNQIRQVLYACTASSIIRRKALDHVGGFCDVYFHGYDDTDFSLLLNIASYKVMYYPQNISYHMVSKTVNQTIGKKRAYYAIRNRLLIMFRTYELRSLIKHIPKNLYFTIKDCLLRHPERIWPALLSWFWLFSYLPIIFNHRKKIKKFRKVKDNKIHLLFNL